MEALLSLGPPFLLSALLVAVRRRFGTAAAWLAVILLGVPLVYLQPSWWWRHGAHFAAGDWFRDLDIRVGLGSALLLAGVAVQDLWRPAALWLSGLAAAVGAFAGLVVTAQFGFESGGWLLLLSGVWILVRWSYLAWNRLRSPLRDEA